VVVEVMVVVKTKSGRHTPNFVVTGGSGGGPSIDGR